MKVAPALLLLSLLVVPTIPALAQVPTGTPPFGSFGGGPFDVVNLGNLNAHFTIPVIQKAGRGAPYTYNISFDTSVWYPTGSSGSQVWTPVPGYGWNYPTPTGYITSQIVQSWTQPCAPPNDMTQRTIQIYSHWLYYDAKGVTHPFGISDSNNIWGCTGAGSPTQSGLATDGSGYTLSVNQTSGTVATPTGQILNTPSG